MVFIVETVQVHINVYKKGTARSGRNSNKLRGTQVRVVMFILETSMQYMFCKPRYNEFIMVYLPYKYGWGSY